MLQSNKLSFIDAFRLFSKHFKISLCSSAISEPFYFTKYLIHTEPQNLFISSRCMTWQHRQEAKSGTDPSITSSIAFPFLYSNSLVC